MNENQSLATLIKNPEFKKKELFKETCTAHIKTFFLSGKHILESVKCASTICKIDESKAAYSSLDQTMRDLNIIFDPYCFCYACDRTYHVKCQNLDLTKFIDLATPFICNECFGKPLNDHAVSYFKSLDWKVGVAARRKRFFSDDAISNNPHLIEEQSMDFPFEDEDIRAFISVEELVDESFNESVLALEKQKLETVKVAVAYKRHLQESNESHHEKDETIRRLREQLEQERNKNMHAPGPSNPRSTTDGPKRVSFGNTRFEFESTRTNASRRFNVTTAEEILANLTNRTNRTNPTCPASTNQANAESNFNLGDSLPSLDDTTLSTTERMLLCSTKAQLQSSQAQTQVSVAMNLDIIRKNLPKITKFKGSARGWLKFKQEVERYQIMGQYPDEVMKMIVLGALDGNAEDRVKDLVDVTSFKQMMDILESSYGHAPTIIKACEDDLLKYRLKGELMRNDAVQINTLIQKYLNACSVAGVVTLNSNMLATHFINQLNTMHKLLFRQHHQFKKPNDSTLMPDLEILFSFLELLSKDLEVRPEEKQSSDKPLKPTQINSVASPTSGSNDVGIITTSTHQHGQDYMFKIMDSSRAKFLGYDMLLLKQVERKCYVCDGTSHFTIECNKFKSMTDAQRRDIVKQKKLCQLCLLTDAHRAIDCVLKLCCGYKCTDSSRCSSKHHILLHDSPLANVSSAKNNHYGGPRRRSNTNNNSRRGRYLANQSIKNSDKEASSNVHNVPNSSTNIQQASTTTTPTTTGFTAMTEPQQIQYATFKRQCQMTLHSSNRTIKVFKHKAYGPSEGAFIYSVGDSAAEISLMREDLRRQLNIEGVKTFIDLQWKDKMVHRVEAVKVDLEIQSLESDELMVLKDVYAVDEESFSLPARSLNVDDLKQRFQYLKNAKFESYSNAKPSLLIGTPHVACFEAIEPVLHGGEGKPVAIRTRLGWSIFGGVPEAYKEESYAVEITSEALKSKDITDLFECDRKLDEIFAYSCSIESLGITPKSTHLTQDEKAAIECIESEWKVVERGAIEVPLAWRKVDGKIPSMPNNYTVVYQRQIAHERKLMKNPVHLKAYNDIFKELLKEGYVREATENDVNIKHENIWYLPMSLAINERKTPIKYRTVYDASARYQNISLNSCLLTGPKLIVDMLQPHFKFRQNKVAFTCDVKSMYHRVHICPRDQQVQRILWRESEEQPMKTYIHLRMLFGPACSPFV